MSAPETAPTSEPTPEPTSAPEPEPAPESAPAPAPETAPAPNVSAALGALQSEDERKSAIVRVSVIGILANVALAAFKAFVGLASRSIAIVLDAVNNLSDAASSVITIAGTRVAGKQADYDHPYGHGRAEYLTTIVVAVVVLWAGITSLVESIEHVLHPETPDYQPITLVIVAVAVVAKLVLGSFVKAQGERLEADTLVASGTDALMDAIISASTLLAAGIYLTTGVSLEPYLGALISLVIIKSGVEILGEAVSKILGERVDPEVAHAVRASVCSVPGVRGAYDLILNDYGPQRLQGSVHVEVDERLTARDIDRLTRSIQIKVLEDTGVVLHTVGVYSTNTADDSQTAAIRAALDELVAEHENVLQVHGLYVDEELKGANFDLVVSFDEHDRAALRDDILAHMHERFPDYSFVAILDSDIAD